MNDPTSHVFRQCKLNFRCVTIAYKVDGKMQQSVNKQMCPGGMS